MQIILQEVSTDRFVAIPEEVRSVYRQWRPTPLYRARRLEQELDTPARIYYKYEGVSPTGSHKPNTAVAQAYYNKQEGVSAHDRDGRRAVGLGARVRRRDLRPRGRRVHGRVSYEQKPYRRGLIEAFGGRVVASPSEETNAGRQILAEHPDSTGSLGIAISEAVEAAAPREDTKYSLGSVLNHVLMHQTVIGEEALLQLESAEDYPDVLIGCTGGGSNFSGLAFPFLGRALREESEIRVIAVEPAACPSLTKGLYAFDFGDTGHLTPLVKMHTLGSTFVPPPFHAGGLRYHGMAPLVSHLKELGLIEARAYTQTEVFEAGVQFARVEGILPAPEANHAVKAAIDEAVRCREEGVSQSILFNLCGHGHFDMGRTSTTSPASSKITRTPRTRSRWRSRACRRSRPTGRRDRAATAPGGRPRPPRLRRPPQARRRPRGTRVRRSCIRRRGVRAVAGSPGYAPEQRDLADAVSRPECREQAAVVAHVDLAVRDQDVVIARLPLAHDDLARVERARRHAFGEPVEGGERQGREERWPEEGEVLLGHGSGLRPGR